MDSNFIDHTTIPLHEQLPKADLERVVAIMTPVSVQKGTVIIKDNQIEKHAYLIHKGVFKSYVTTEEKEITFWFAKESDIINASFGYMFQQKGYENIQALEDAELYKINIAMLHTLCEKHIAIANWVRNITELEAIKLEERYLNYIILKPEERYLKLLVHNAALFRRVQLKEIASFLGISPVSLSRIRTRIK